MSEVSNKGVDRRAMTGLSAGHLFTDLNQGAVAALVPFLTAERGISLAAAGALVFAATVSSSIVQPLFGIFSDKKPIPALMPLGVLLAGCGMALVGVAPSYPLILLCVVVSGIGVAAFHPEAARFANYVSGSGRARGMSFFSVGGNAGFALGPAVTTPLVLLFGLPGSVFLALPAVAMAAVLFHELPRMLTFRPEAVDSEEQQEDVAPEHWGPFARMIGVVIVRSFVYFGLVAFVALYYERVLGVSPALGNVALTLMLFGGAAGTLAMGPLADRFGRRTVVGASMLVLPALNFLLHPRRTLLRDGAARPRGSGHGGDLRHHGGHGTGVFAGTHRARGGYYYGPLHRARRRRGPAARPRRRQQGALFHHDGHRIIAHPRAPSRPDPASGDAGPHVKARTVGDPPHNRLGCTLRVRVTEHLFAFGVG